MKIFGIEIGGGNNNKKSKGGSTKNGARPSSDAISNKPKQATQKRIVSKKILERRQEKLVKSISGLPKHEGLADESNSPFHLTDAEKKNFAILIIENKTKKVVIVASSRRMQIPIDGTSDKIKSMGRKDSWTIVDTIYLESSLIKDIYVQYHKEGNHGDDSEMARQFDDIVRYACDNSISDVHFEVTENQAVVRVRRNSLLEDYTHMGVDFAFDFCTVVYQVLSEGDSKDISFLPRKQQSSVIERQIQGHGTIRIRLNTIPTAPSGFDMVLRILKSGEDVKLTLGQLGYNKILTKSLELASSKPVGALIIAGTTGSGKSTTLKTLLESKVEQFMTPNGCTIKIITVEDPPEYDIKGVSQCNVSTSRAGGDEGATKNPFKDAIKAAMRCDPDILMAGEVRDEDSAELLMHITLTGHQVMTTIHASSAISIVARLRNMGVPSDALGNSDFLSGLVYQKLVPKACNACGIDINAFTNGDLKDSDRELLGRIDKVFTEDQKKGIVFRNLNGCDECRSGVVGQTVVAEVILPDHEMLGYFISAEDHKAWHHHRKMGGKTIIDHAHEKIIDGICDPRDVEVKINLITFDLVQDDGMFEYSEMKTHGVNEKDLDDKFIKKTMCELDDVRKAKVIRAQKFIESRRQNSDISSSAPFDQDILATMVANQVFDLDELSRKMGDAGHIVNVEFLRPIQNDIINILR